MKKNKNGFSIIIGMGIMILIILTAYVILAFIIPFSRNIKGIENSSNAYYQGSSGIEKSLIHTKTRTLLITETGANIGASVGYKYSTFSSGSTIPKPGYGNSEYNSGYNIISQTEPIQLEIGRKSHLINNLGDNDIIFNFKVPDLGNGIKAFSGNSNYPVINWILSSETNTLIASGSYVKGNEIIDTNPTSLNWNIRNQNGLTIYGSGLEFWEFYEDNCDSVGSGCTLKMSVLNKLELSNGTEIPYLEYKIIFPSSFKVPDRYTRIESYGKSYGFQKKLDVRVPQQTINQVFDFTVFQ